ncbi:N-methylhydantoinase A/oxoprolinase/acetone carboxylase, beta subunit [Yoonia rosea]|uniref:N-methylhydantoinase A/oxoprolinase/acetone carboxylase, beta subunit n=1 Tax=Yoonia rosea TaxID=287098 RepID=A0A1R3XCK2_9RHOB|nr:hydantoinase/oxoprolinase family protein [Yoonia rosea]SIT88888.1 N-methylhydantoinase A/oxoprolinase/acetone carboxylase, beta subunit [Yoonia rosea]
MTYLLGVDTGGTYTDAVIIDEARDKVLGSAKALTSRPDLAAGVGGAIDAAIAQAAVKPADIAMVSLSTTLATNALVEGQGGRIALVAIGFDDADLARAGLTEALRGDPVIRLAGGHNHAGGEAAALDLATLHAALADLEDGITGFAVAASFATRNPAHEIAVRDVLRNTTGQPVSCSHELSQALGGPKRALTAVLNARLIGMLDRLITACEAHLTAVGIMARLMVVRGDGALVSADLAREKPIETILSGPAASIAGASWLTGETDALVSDIGGTTTDVCLLRDGRPKIDPQGARVGPFRTMVEAVAMRTTGLGGDSEVHVVEGLHGGLRLGPRRLMPVSLAAQQYPDLVHAVLDRALAQDIPATDGGQFVIPLWQEMPAGLDKREQIVAARLAEGPLRLGHAVQSRMESPALGRLVERGLAILAGVTPSDASHVLGMVDAWDAQAAEKALTLFARRRTGAGTRVAENGQVLAQQIIDQLTAQTVDCLLQAAFAEDDLDWPDPAALAKHPLSMAGLDRHSGVVRMQLSLGVPVIGLGASAAAYYGAVGDRLGTRMVLPEHGGVANAIGAVVGQVRMQATGTVTSAGEGSFAVHLTDGPKIFADRDEALGVLETALREEAEGLVRASGVEEIRFSVSRDISEITVENRAMFIEATLRVEASGRPRIASR